MEKGMNRREFFRATATTGICLLTGNFLRGVSWAQGAVNIPESEKIVISVITDNYADFLRPHDKIAKRPVMATSHLDRIYHAEHGLAYHIETVVNGESHSCIFDFAVVPDGVIRNMKLLNIDFAKIEALGLSHPHFDHFHALNEILKTNKDSFRKGIPFYVGERFFITGGGNLKREDIEGLGIVKIIEIKEPTPIMPGAYLPGKIELVTDYETGGETLVGEQAVILNTKGKGLVVLSGCAHRGIVNTVKQAQKMTGIEKVCVVMGGFHLINAHPEVIKKTVADIKAINPEYIVPMHCTGFEGISAFAREMPDQFILNTAGTKYTITK